MHPSSMVVEKKYLKAIMSQPGAHPTVDEDSQRVERM
jgi:hypothetical protein